MGEKKVITVSKCKVLSVGDSDFVDTVLICFIVKERVSMRR